MSLNLGIPSIELIPLLVTLATVFSIYDALNPFAEKTKGRKIAAAIILILMLVLISPEMYASWVETFK